MLNACWLWLRSWCGLGGSETDVPSRGGGFSTIRFGTYPVFPVGPNEVSGCFVTQFIGSGRFGGTSAHVPGNLGLSSAGKLLCARLLGRIQKKHSEKSSDYPRSRGPAQRPRRCVVYV
jgi:hypothetical protein